MQSTDKTTVQATGKATDKSADTTTARVKAKDQLNQHLCPHCKSSHTHRSQRRTLADRVMALSGRKVFRCSDCRHRFYHKAR